MGAQQDLGDTLSQPLLVRQADCQRLGAVNVEGTSHAAQHASSSVVHGLSLAFMQYLHPGLK